MKKIGTIQVKYIFYFFALLGILLFFLYAFIQNDDKAFSWMVMENNSSLQFSDYFRHIGYAKRHGSIYQQGNDVCYPPLAYLFYYFLWRINPYSGSMQSWSDWPQVQNTPYNLLIFLLYSITACLLLYYAIQRYLVNKQTESFLLTLILIFSLPFFSAAIERGNLVLVVCVLLILALALKDSQKAVCRESALLCIAIAACCKLYPALFGLLYIKEKRYQEAARLLIYGLVLFFVPFLFFGGLDGLAQYIETSRELSGMVHFRWASVSGLISNLFYQSQGWEGMRTGWCIGSILSTILMLILAVRSFFDKCKWRTLLSMAGVFSVCIPSAHRYSACFFVLPLLALIKENGELPIRGNHRMSLIFFLLAQIFSIPTLFLMIPALSAIYVEKLYYVFVYSILLFAI